MFVQLETLMGLGIIFVVHLVVESICHLPFSPIFVPKVYPMGKDVRPMIPMAIACVRVEFV